MSEDNPPVDPILSKLLRIILNPSTIAQSSLLTLSVYLGLRFYKFNLSRIRNVTDLTITKNQKMLFGHVAKVKHLVI
jgi:hypothetical protein